MADLLVLSRPAKSVQNGAGFSGKTGTYWVCCSPCTNQQPPQRGGAVPNPVWVGSKWLLAFPRVPVTPGTPLHFFAMLPPERPQKGSTQPLQNRSPVFTFSFLLPSLALLRLLILLLLLMSGNCYVVSIYLLVLIRVYSSVEPKFCDRYSLLVKCIDTLSNEFTRFGQPTAALV